MNDSSVVLNKG